MSMFPTNKPAQANTLTSVANTSNNNNQQFTKADGWMHLEIELADGTRIGIKHQRGRTKTDIPLVGDGSNAVFSQLLNAAVAHEESGAKGDFEVKLIGTVKLVKGAEEIEELSFAPVK